MNYIIDFNILFSSMLSGKGFYKTLFRDNNFFTPDYIFIELQKYENQIINNTKLEFDQLVAYCKFLFNNLIVFPNLILSLNAKQLAYELCYNIDLKDIACLSLSIDSGFPLLTRDEILYKGVRGKGYKNIILFSDFLSSNSV